MDGVVANASRRRIYIYTGAGSPEHPKRGRAAPRGKVRAIRSRPATWPEDAPGDLEESEKIVLGVSMVLDVGVDGRWRLS